MIAGPVDAGRTVGVGVGAAVRNYVDDQVLVIGRPAGGGVAVGADVTLGAVGEIAVVVGMRSIMTASSRTAREGAGAGGVVTLAAADGAGGGPGRGGHAVVADHGRTGGSGIAADLGRGSGFVIIGAVEGDVAGIEVKVTRASDDTGAVDRVAVAGEAVVGAGLRQRVAAGMGRMFVAGDRPAGAARGNIERLAGGGMAIVAGQGRGAGPIAAVHRHVAGVGAGTVGIVDADLAGHVAGRVDMGRGRGGRMTGVAAGGDVVGRGQMLGVLAGGRAGGMTDGAVGRGDTPGRGDDGGRRSGTVVMAGRGGAGPDRATDRFGSGGVTHTGGEVDDVVQVAVADRVGPVTTGAGHGIDTEEGRRSHMLVMAEGPRIGGAVTEGTGGRRSLPDGRVGGGGRVVAGGVGAGVSTVDEGRFGDGGVIHYRGGALE